MKRFLSILASLGLVATASMSVVSCTKKDKTPTYKSFTDIRSWSFMKDSEIIPANQKDSQGNYIGLMKGTYDAEVTKPEVSEVRNLIVGNIANKFKNPEDFIKDAKNFNLTIPGENPFTQINSDDSVWIAKLEPQQNSQQNQNTQSVSIKIKVSNKAKVFSLNDIEPLSVPLGSSQSNNVISTIRSLGIEMAQNWSQVDTFIETKKDARELMQMDSELFDQLVSSLNTKSNLYVPDVKDEVRYDSVKQQICMSYSTDSKTKQLSDGLTAFNDKLIEFNTEILKGLKTEINGQQAWNSMTADLISIFNRAVSKLDTNGKSLFKAVEALSN